MSILRLPRQHAGPWWLMGALAVFWGSLVAAQKINNQWFTMAWKYGLLSAEDLKEVSIVRIGRDMLNDSSIEFEFSENHKVATLHVEGLLKDFDSIMPVKIVRMGEVMAIDVDVSQQRKRSWRHRFSIQRIDLPISIQRVEGQGSLRLEVNSMMPALTVSSCTVNLKGNGQIDRLTVSDWAACPQESGSISLDVKVNQHLHMITHARSVELKGASLNAKQVDLKLKADNIKLSVDSMRPWMNSQKQGEAAAWKLVEIQAGDSPQFPMETAENPSAQAVVIRPQWTSEQPPAIPIKR